MKKEKKKIIKLEVAKKVENAELKVVEKPQDLTIVLNGGGREMKGATIPVKWHFSRDLALKEPTHILLVDLTEVEAQENINNSGRRYLVEVEKAAKFLQVFKSGKHIMLALAFKHLGIAASFLVKKESNPSFYEEPICISLVRTNKLSSNSNHSHTGMLVASTVVDFTVPSELFAKRPETKMGKLFFNYLYWPKRSKPTDECQVRKLVLFTAIPKLPFFLLVNLLYAFYLPVASLILLFFGYQSIGLKEIFRRISSVLTEGYEVDVYARGASWTNAREIYEGDLRTDKETWFSPFHLTGFFSFLALSLLLFSWFNANVFAPGLTVLSLLGTLVFLSLILRRFFDEEYVYTILSAIILLYSLAISIILLFYRDIPKVEYRDQYLWLYAIEMVVSGFLLTLLLKGVITGTDWYEKNFTKKKESDAKKNMAEKRTYSNYLLENFTTPEKEVDLKHLPGTFEGSKLKRDLTIRFWSAKADVCKPYES